MMRRALLVPALALLVAAPSTVLAQQSEADRLRDALRSVTIQARALEDQRAQLQARLAEADREKQRANEAAEQLRRQLKEAQDALQQAVQEFNQRLVERDETLDKWKTAYNEAADVARQKDAERARFESEATAFKARTKVCETRNAKLMSISNQILAGFRDLSPMDDLLQKEPSLGRMAHQNRVQDFRDCILDQDVKLPAPAADQKAQDQKGQEQKSPQEQKPQGRKADASQAPGDRKAETAAAPQGRRRVNAKPAENQDKDKP